MPILAVFCQNRFLSITPQTLVMFFNPPQFVNHSYSPSRQMVHFRFWQTLVYGCVSVFVRVLVFSHNKPRHAALLSLLINQGLMSPKKCTYTKRDSWTSGHLIIWICDIFHDIKFVDLLFSLAFERQFLCLFLPVARIRRFTSPLFGFRYCSYNQWNNGCLITIQMALKHSYHK